QIPAVASRTRAPAHRCAVKAPPFRVLDFGGGMALPRCCQLHGFPSARPLFAQDRDGSERIAAVQRKRVVENVQDAHDPSHAALCSSERSAGRSTTLRRNASNMSNVQSDELLSRRPDW